MTYRTLKLIIGFIMIGLVSFWIGILVRLRHLSYEQPIVSSAMLVQFFDVGDGDAAMVTLPNKTSVLIDTGSNELGAREIVTQIRRLNLKMPLAIILTNAHENSIGGLSYLLGHMPFHGLIVLPCSLSQFKKIGGDVASKAVASASDSNLKLLTWSDLEANPNRLSLFTSLASINFLPVTDQESGASDYALALRVDYGAGSLLYTSGLTANEENLLVAKRAHLQCDVLGATAGAADGTLSSEFLALCAPRVAVISTSSENPPDPESLARLEAADAKVQRTDTLGTISLLLKDKLNDPIETLAYNTIYSPNHPNPIRSK